VEKNNIQIQLSVPRRQSPAAIILILARFFRKLARQAWPLIIIVFFRRGGEEKEGQVQAQREHWLVYVLYFAIVMTTFSMIASVIAYWRFYFYTTDEEFIIERGFFNKVKLSVPFHRIQTINFKRGVLHKALGVVGLEIDTAGSQGKELTIEALTEAEANLIRQFLLEKRGNQVAEKKIEENIIDEPEEESLLMQLQITDLLKIGFGQNHLRTVGIIIAFIFGLFEFAQDIMGEAVNKQAETFGFWILNSFFLFLLIVVPILLITAFLLTLIRTVLRYYNLRFFRTTGGYRVVSGLFTEQERNAALNKIQLVQWQDNPLYRWFKMYAIRLKQASSAVVANRQAINIPGAYAQQVQVVRDAYFPVNDPALFTEHGIDSSIIGRRLIYQGILPALGLILLTFSPLGLKALWWLLLIPVVWQASRIYHRNWLVALHPDGCQLKHGIWNMSYIVLQWYKIQAVELRQSPYQRRHGLANLYLYTAAGAVSIPYLPLAKAVALKDYVLLQVETDRRGWM